MILGKNLAIERTGTVKFITFMLLVLLSFTPADPAFGAISGSLLPNGDFETGSVSPWRMDIKGSGNLATLALASSAFSGKYAARISVTSCKSPYPYGYIAFNSPMLMPTGGEKYTLTFTYKASNLFEAYFICQTSTAQVYYRRLVCYASSAWKTVSFEVGPLLPAIKNWFTLRFNRLNTVTIDNVKMMPVGKISSTPTPTPAPTATPTSTPVPTPSLTPTPKPTAAPAPTISPTPVAIATPVPTLKPTSSPTPNPAPSSTPTPTPTPTVPKSLGVYADSACTRSVFSIDWGTISPGATITKIFYVKNAGSSQVTLSLTRTNWNPTTANGPITVNWNREGATLAANQVVSATLTLSVAPSATFSTFSVDAVVTGTT